jgi:hypothetical protein
MLLQRAADGLPAPALDKRPDLLPGLDFYFTAYRELRYDRPIGMSLGPIPWSSVVRWGEIHGITDPDELAVLEHHIRAMESALAEIEDRREKNKGKGAA